MLERPSDDDCVVNKQRSIILTRQVLVADDHQRRKSSRQKATNQGEAVLLDMEHDETPLFDRTIPSDRNGNNKERTDNIDTFSPDELDIDTQRVQPSPKPVQSKNRTIPSPKRTSTLPINKIKNAETRRSASKIPVRSQSKSRSPSLTQSQRQAPSGTSKGAFHYFIPEEHSSERNAGSSSKDDRERISSSEDDDEDVVDASPSKEGELKLKLKLEKRHGKRTGELLNKLHESYEELLEKYAHAENTIDQLRFQPKICGDNTPRSTTSERPVRVMHQPNENRANLRSSGAYRSSTGSPLSWARPVPSTTTTTPAKKSISPTNSGTIESVFFDEAVPQQIVVQQLRSSPETLKLDLLIQTRTLGSKMKSFLTLMDANQLSLAEQKQVYESIRHDYENLMVTFDKKKRDGELADLNLDTDLNQELETMKQLLKEIVKRITENLLEKSENTSPMNQPTRSNRNDDTHSNHSSVRSSLCNHNDLMDQYEKLLNAVNTGNIEKQNSMPLKTTVSSRYSSRSNLSDPQRFTKNKPKPYVYVSGDSDDDEQQQSNDITPIPFMHGIESTSNELDYIPSVSVQHHQHKIEDQVPRYVNTNTRKKPPSNKQVYDYLENETKADKKKTTHNHQSNLFIPPKEFRSPAASPRRRSDEYQNGLAPIDLRSSQLYFTPTPESHLHSPDDERESISSSQSNGSGSRSPPNKQPRRKPTGHSDLYPSDRQSQITGSFEPLPSRRKMQRSSHTWRPRRTSVPRRSHVSATQQTTSLGQTDYQNYHRPWVTPHISSISSSQQQTKPIRYSSSIYINQTHTHQRALNPPPSTNFYYSPTTGTIYRSPYSMRMDYQPSFREDFYQCPTCGIRTTYHHRHHSNSAPRRTPSYLEDLGYESGYRHQYLDDSSSSDSSDSDVISSYREMMALNEAYHRAEKVQHHSRSLSRYITRQLKLVLAAL